MITLQISAGASYQLDWESGMNIQQALEVAYNNAANGSFTYSLQYFGASLGYLVTMINETYETYNSKEAPYFFWEINLNDKPITAGIDFIILNDGDKVTFTFETYNPATHTNTTLQTKYNSKL